MRTLFVLIALLLVVGCDRAGPAEKAGREIDKAGQAASRNIENAADNIRDAAKGKK